MNAFVIRSRHCSTIHWVVEERSEGRFTMLDRDGEPAVCVSAEELAELLSPDGEYERSDEVPSAVAMGPLEQGFYHMRKEAGRA